jgi:serine/threonine protein kinase
LKWKLDSHNNRENGFFGINKIFQECGIHTVNSQIAPEVLRGGKYTKKSDVYSFGIFMWELWKVQSVRVNNKCE